MLETENEADQLKMEESGPDNGTTGEIPFTSDSIILEIHQNETTVVTTETPMEMETNSNSNENQPPPEAKAKQILGTELKLEAQPEMMNTESVGQLPVTSSSTADDLLLDTAEANVAEPESEDIEAQDHSETPGLYYWRYDSVSKNPPPFVVSDETEFQENCILKGCKWAPDGSCLLTNSNDCCLRLFNLPSSAHSVADWATYKNDDSNTDEPWNSVLKIREGGQVYDYCFYPRMTSYDPISSCFLTSASDNPIHLWDAFNGSLRCSYLAYNESEVLISAHSVAFDPLGEKIYCGFDKSVRIFDITRPGRQCVARKLKQKGLTDLNLTGIVSCIALSPSLKDVYALGTFRNKLGLYLDDGTVICVLEGHYGGLTHLQFSHDGTKLFSGCRKDARLICWDLRNMGEEYQILNRVVNTNQRIYFDITSNDRYLLSGGTDGKVKVWDLLSPVPENEGACSWEFTGSTDCVNGVSLNPCIPLLATTSGQRHFHDIADEDEDRLFVEARSKQSAESTVRLFNVACANSGDI